MHNDSVHRVLTYELLTDVIQIWTWDMFLCIEKIQAIYMYIAVNRRKPSTLASSKFISKVTVNRVILKSVFIVIVCNWVIILGGIMLNRGDNKKILCRIILNRGDNKKILGRFILNRGESKKILGRIILNRGDDKKILDNTQTTSV